jgi:tetratricopeptide (TPR) repeat protein
MGMAPRAPIDTMTFELRLIGTDKPYIYRAVASTTNLDRAVESRFQWRSDSTALAQDLAAIEESTVSAGPPANDTHIQLGRRLFSAVFAGPVEEQWVHNLGDASSEPMRLRIRIDPASARPLLNLPWEYLHDGSMFLALNRRIHLSRLPIGATISAFPPIQDVTRVLVVIAAPTGLHDDMVLNTAREEDLILSSTAAARRGSATEVAFSPNGSLDGVAHALDEFDPHVLHFAGHGVFDHKNDSGSLLMEAEDGSLKSVSNAEFATTLKRHARSLRLVFLATCQSAKAPRRDGYADLTPRLLDAGIPSVIAMQFAILDQSAMEFGAAFYRGVAEGLSVEEATTAARIVLGGSSRNTADFATPVLILSDPQCMRMERSTNGASEPPAVVDLAGLTRAGRFVGRSAELRVLQTNLDPGHGRWRAAIVYGLPGMGKTALAVRLAERMCLHMDGVKSFSLTAGATAFQILDELAAFLTNCRDRLGPHEIDAFARSLQRDEIVLQDVVDELMHIMRKLRLLLIFDDCADALAGAVPTADATTQHAVADPELAKLIGQLLDGIQGSSRLLVTSRVDFSPACSAAARATIGHLGLGEMGFRDAVYLMETLQPLNQMPIGLHGDAFQGAAPITMRALYRRVGGHPYLYDLCALEARNTSLSALFGPVADARPELIAYSLLQRVESSLSEQAAELLRRASIFKEPVPLRGLRYIMSEPGGTLPDVTAEVADLQHLGLLTQPIGSVRYTMPALVRNRTWKQIDSASRRDLLLHAGSYWMAEGKDDADPSAVLVAYSYVFEAGSYELAARMLYQVAPWLRKRGQNELLRGLLDQSVRTLEGAHRTLATANLAAAHQEIGDYGRARKLYDAALTEIGVFTEDNKGHIQLQFGDLSWRLGEYQRALEHYEAALAVWEERGNGRKAAITLHRIGLVHEKQDQYPMARAFYERSLSIQREVGSRSDVAATLHQLANVHLLVGEYRQARELYEQAVAEFEVLHERSGAAAGLHQLGILHQLCSEYEEARECYQQALVIHDTIGDQMGVVGDMFHLASLLQLEGEQGRARVLYERCLGKCREIGAQHEEATCLYQLGLLSEEQSEFDTAADLLQQALRMHEAMNAQGAVAACLQRLTSVYFHRDQYTLAYAAYRRYRRIRRRLGDRSVRPFPLIFMAAAAWAQRIMGGATSSPGP